MKQLTYIVKKGESNPLFKAFEQLVLFQEEGRFQKVLKGYHLSVIKINGKQDVLKLDNKQLVALLLTKQNKALPVTTLDDKIIKYGSFLSPAELTSFFEGLSLQIDNPDDS